MVNKKGYIKTLEAVIAVIMIVIISYTLIAMPTETPPDVPSIVKGAQNVIDQSIQFNETIRTYLAKRELTFADEEILQEQIISVIDRQAPPGYDYTCLICSNPGTCLTNTPLDKSVYMTDVLVASSEEQQNVMIVRVWFWKMPTLGDNNVTENMITGQKCPYNRVCLSKIEYQQKIEERTCGDPKGCYYCAK